MKATHTTRYCVAILTTAATLTITAAAEPPKIVIVPDAIIIPGAVQTAPRNEARFESLYVPVPTEQIYKAWEPSAEDIEALAKMAWGEARGCGERGIRAAMECAIQRLHTGEYGKTLTEVVSAPCQFYGYSTNNPVTQEIKSIAERALIADHYGFDMLLPSGYLWFTGRSGENIFRNAKGETWQA